MKKTLKKYNTANIFCLSERVGNVYISKDDAIKIIEMFEIETYEYLKELFYKVKESGYFENNYDFDTLYNDIQEECLNKKDYFIADKIDDGKTKYGNDGCIYTMYHEINRLYFDSFKLLGYQFFKKEEVIIEDEVLKNNLIRTEIKYNNYSTIGPLFRMYYFELNDTTREWLLKKGDVLNFNGLEDFALLHDNQLLYSTCTHEGIK